MNLHRWLFAAILVVACALRATTAAREPLIGLEYVEFIPAAATLTVDHHPIRAAQHPGLPLYCIRAGMAVFGNTTIGARIPSVLAGVATIWLLYLIAAQWWGRAAGLVAAAVLAIERYHVAISAHAVDLPFDLLFVTVALLCFSRFLHLPELPSLERRKGLWLIGAGFAVGLGFLCKELTALLLPAFFLSFFATGRAQWLRRPAPWLAVAACAVCIAPDAYSNLTVTTAERMDLLRRHREAARALELPEVRHKDYANGLYMNYGDQLSRFRGIGPSSEPFYFYFGDVLEMIDHERRNRFGEFPYLNPLLAAALWFVAAFGLTRPTRDPWVRALRTSLLVLFVPFTLLKIGPPRAVLPSDSVALWYWVDRTLPCLLLLVAHEVGVLARSMEPSGSEALPVVGADSLLGPALVESVGPAELLCEPEPSSEPEPEQPANPG